MNRAMIGIVALAFVVVGSAVAGADESANPSSSSTPRNDAAAAVSGSSDPGAIGNPASSDGQPAPISPAAQAAKALAVAAGPRVEGGQINGHWREGTRLVDQLGQFKVTSDRISFTSADGSLRFDCLENLCCQRVARTVTDSPETLVWSVTGELTEFRGANFLLLTEAILKPKPARASRAP